MHRQINRITFTLIYKYILYRLYIDECIMYILQYVGRDQICMKSEYMRNICNPRIKGGWILFYF